MKNLKYLILVFTMVLLCGCSFGEGSNTDETNASESIVYATEISFETKNLNFFVGDSINLNDLKLKILPTNVTVKPKFQISNLSVAKIENNKITFTNIGETELTVSILSDINTYKTSSLKVTINEKPVFADFLKLENTNVTLNLDETAINRLTINPSNYNQEINISYIIGNIIDYNYLTGEIKPINVGEETVNIQVKNNENNYLTTSFKVEVTNNIYATNLSNLTINNKVINEEITLFKGEKGTINYTVEPSNYNLETTFSVSNSLISVNKNGEFIVNNNVGECSIFVSVISKNDVITKEIKVTIIDFPTNLNFELKYNDENVDIAYVGTTYYANVLNDNLNYTNIIFENCNYELIENNKFKISFASTGATTIKLKYSCSSFLSTKHFETSKEIQVYNLITDVNFSLFANNEIIPNNNVYTIYLPNEEYYEDAVENNEVVFANINLSPKGINTKPNALSLELNGDSVTLVDNKLVPKQVGETTLKIVSNDLYNFEKVVVIKVEPLKVKTISSKEEFVLYLNGDDSHSGSAELIYSVQPFYAYNTDVNIEYDSNIIKIENNVIYAKNAGKTTLTLSANNIVKTVKVEVKYVPTNICAYINNEIINNNQEIEAFTEKDYYINCLIMSNETELNVLPTINVDGNIETTNNLKLKFSVSGTHNIIISYDNLEFNFVLNVKLLNPILSFNFENDFLQINQFFVNEQEINYNITLKFDNEPTTDVLTFESNNETVVSVLEKKLIINSIGTAQIFAKINDNVVATLNLEIYYKEYEQINSYVDFINIQENKNYIVNSDLDFSNFTVNNILNFDGEIDFNNHTITNVNTQLFNCLGSNSVIKNVVVSGVSNIISGSNFSIFANETYGKIFNVTLKDLTILSTSNNPMEIATICLNNNGLISNVVFNNVTLRNTYEFTKYTGMVMAGICVLNNNIISEITGEISFEGFTKVGGVSVEGCGEIKDCNITINYICSQELQQIGGLVHTTNTKYVNGITKDAEFNNLDITINIFFNNSTLTFGGLIWNNKSCLGSNINLYVNFNGEIAKENAFLMYYKFTEDYLISNITEISCESNTMFELYPV